MVMVDTLSNGHGTTRGDESRSYQANAHSELTSTRVNRSRPNRLQTE